MKLKGKNILIVGATSGIGQSMINVFQSEGAKLTLTSRNLDGLKQHSNCEKINLDVTQIDDSIIKGLNSFDGIVYTPGLVKLFPASYINEKHMDEVRMPIFDGAVLLISKLLRFKKINSGASLVFISSISSNFPYKGGAIYTSSKAALETYSKTLALELSDKGIRSNCIKAGLVDTEILQKTQSDMPEQVYAEHIKRYPLGLGKPIDVALATSFLLSDDARWITGTEIVLDGGLTAGA